MLDRMTAKLHRALRCLLVWCLPLIGNRLGLMLAPRAEPDAGVNMFGLTEGQHTFALIGLGIGLVAAIAVIVLARLGWAWLGIAVVVAAVGLWVVGLLFPQPRTGYTAALVMLLIAPVVGALATKGPRPRRA